MKDRLPIIIVALAGVFVVALAVRLRSRLSTPPPQPRVAEQRPETSGTKDLSARVEERLRMLRAEHARRLSGDDEDEPESGGAGGGGRTVARQPGQRAAGEAETQRRRGAVELPVPNADAGQTVAELKHTLTTHPSREKRIEAARELGAMEEPDAMQVLVDAMNDRDPEVRAEVIDALQEYLEDLTPDVLQPVLKDNDPNVRFEAVTLLGLMGGPDAMIAAGKLTDDSDADVRELAEEVQQVLASDPTPFPVVTPPHRMQYGH